MRYKNFFINIFTILRSIWMTGMNAFNKRETIMYPDTSINLSPRFRGRIVLTRDSDGNERCVACNLCAVACPVGCISLKKSQNNEGRWYPEFFRINFSRCIFCGMCEEACPTMAIQLSSDFEMSDFKRQDLIYEKSDLLITGTGKHAEYNFYNVSGVSLKDKKNDNSKYQINAVDVKSLLP